MNLGTDDIAVEAIAQGSEHSEDDETKQFLGDNEDLLWEQEKTKRTITHKDRFSRFLAIVLLLCIILTVLISIALFIVYRSSNSASKIANLHKCRILDDYLKLSDGKKTKAHQLYFSDEFLAKMHKRIRANFMNAVDQQLQLGDALIKITSVAYDVKSPIDQNRNFLYLTGINHVEFEVILDLKTKESILFVPKLVKRELFDSPEMLKQRFEMDHVYPLSDLKDVIRERFRTHAYNIDAHNSLYSIHLDSNTDELTFNRLRVNKFIPVLNSLRDIKTPEELQILRKVNEITSYAHTMLMKLIPDHSWEIQIDSYFTSLCKACGVPLGYESVVSVGGNAAIPHYFDKVARAKSNDMLLIDAGASLLGYVSDITRTYPLSKFNNYQRALYSSVLKVQKSALSEIKPGANFTRIEANALRNVAEELKHLKLVSDSLTVEEIQGLDLDFIFMQHGLGHFVGLQVHDTTTIPEKLLQENMVLAIEPAIYLDQLDHTKLTVPQLNAINMERVNEFKKANAHGVRIEDNVVVTATGYELLNNVPKELEDVEKARQHRMKSGY